MKSYTTYVCETCGYKSRSFDDMEQHEADHLGLTVVELHEYHALKRFASYMGSVIFEKKNEETEKQFDKAVGDLMAFEEKHNLAPF